MIHSRSHLHSGRSRKYAEDRDGHIISPGLSVKAAKIETVVEINVRDSGVHQCGTLLAALAFSPREIIRYLSLVVYEARAKSDGGVCSPESISRQSRFALALLFVRPVERIYGY